MHKNKVEDISAKTLIVRKVNGELFQNASEIIKGRLIPVEAFNRVVLESAYRKLVKEKDVNIFLSEAK